jgi:hypothetical protein
VGTGVGTETLTVALALLFFSTPLHVSEYVVLVVGVTTCVPLVALDPVNVPPLAVQLVAFVVDQESVDDPPDVIETGEAERETTGTGEGVGVGVGTGVGDDTETETDLEDVPPAPVQERLYVVFDVGEKDCEPLGVFVSDHPPEAEHEVASVDDHERVVL